MESWSTRLVVGLLLTAVSTVPLRAEPKTPAVAGSAGGWESLFSGKDLTGWRIFNPHGGKADPNAWVAEDGTLIKKGKGYLESVGTYGDFVLDLEFKVGPKTNSGIFLRFDPEYSAGTPRYWWNGVLEIQLFDSFGHQPPTKHDCGALYDMVAPSENTMHAPGEWNRMTMTAHGSRIEVVLNGKKIVDANLDDWTTAGKNPDGSDLKYRKAMKDAPRQGHILLQDHGSEIWFRNIRLKPL